MSIINRVQGMVLRGRIIAARAVNETIQRCDVQVLVGDTPADVDQLAQYGFASVPLEGADAIVVAVQGKAEDLVIIAVDDRRHRPTGLQPGDVCLYDHRGNQITLKSDRIACAAPERVEFVSPRVDLGESDLLATAGVVQGEAVDPFTGLTHFALGNASTRVFAKK